MDNLTLSFTIFYLFRNVSISKKHHYLPEFYLKGFANESNKLFIYDKKRNVIKKGDYSPSTHFFDLNRNSVEINGELDDFPETMYSKIDDNDKEIIHFIQSQNSVFSLDSYQIFQLQMFISNFIWRNPQFDEEYTQAIINNDPKSNFFRIRNTKDDSDAPQEIVDQIKNWPVFIKSFRSSYGILKWMTNKTKYDHEKWRIAYNPKNYVLVSDHPLIKSSSDSDFFKANFVFPLSKKFTLVRFLNDLKANQLPPDFTLLVDVLIMQQAEYYVGCSDRQHLEQVVSILNSVNMEWAKNKLFDILNNCTNG